MNKLHSLFVYALAPLFLVVFWFVLTEWHLVSPIFLPRPVEVIRVLWSSFVDRTLFVDLGYTLYRVFFGFGIAALIGVPVGLLMGYSKHIYRSLEFIVEFFRSIPATALFPLFLLMLGIGEQAKIGISAWSSGLVIVLNSMYGVHMGKELRRKAARAMNAGSYDMFTKVVLPDALPQIFTGFRVALSLALVVVVVTEMFVGTNEGIGHRIIDAQLSYRIDDMYASIFVIGVIGFSLNKLLARIESRVVHWRGK